MDCFGDLRNPFIHPDTSNPTMATARQRPLVGPGRQERQEICSKAFTAWESFLNKEEISESGWSSIERFLDALCEEILRQRDRLGGDWVVAGCLFHRRMRDRVRLNLRTAGVRMVHLSMEEEEDITTRLARRHGDAVEILMVSLAYL